MVLVAGCVLLPSCIPSTHQPLTHALLLLCFRVLLKQVSGVCVGAGVCARVKLAGCCCIMNSMEVCVASKTMLMFIIVFIRPQRYVAAYSLRYAPPPSAEASVAAAAAVLVLAGIKYQMVKQMHAAMTRAMTTLFRDRFLLMASMTVLMMGNLAAEQRGQTGRVRKRCSLISTNAVHTHANSAHTCKVCDFATR